MKAGAFKPPNRRQALPGGRVLHTGDDDGPRTLGRSSTTQAAMSNTKTRPLGTQRTNGHGTLGQQQQGSGRFPSKDADDDDDGGNSVRTRARSSSSGRGILASFDNDKREKALEKARSLGLRRAKTRSPSPQDHAVSSGSESEQDERGRRGNSRGQSTASTLDNSWSRRSSFAHSGRADSPPPTKTPLRERRGSMPASAQPFTRTRKQLDARPLRAEDSRGTQKEAPATPVAAGSSLFGAVWAKASQVLSAARGNGETNEDKSLQGVITPFELDDISQENKYNDSEPPLPPRPVSMPPSASDSAAYLVAGTLLQKSNSEPRRLPVLQHANTVIAVPTGAAAVRSIVFNRPPQIHPRDGFAIITSNNTKGSTMSPSAGVGGVAMQRERSPFDWLEPHDVSPLDPFLFHRLPGRAQTRRPKVATRVTMPADRGSMVHAMMPTVLPRSYASQIEPQIHAMQPIAHSAHLSSHGGYMMTNYLPPSAPPQPILLPPGAHHGPGPGPAHSLYGSPPSSSRPPQTSNTTAQVASMSYVPPPSIATLSSSAPPLSTGSVSTELIPPSMPVPPTMPPPSVMSLPKIPISKTPKPVVPVASRPTSSTPLIFAPVVTAEPTLLEEPTTAGVTLEQTPASTSATSDEKTTPVATQSTATSKDADDQLTDAGDSHLKTPKAGIKIEEHSLAVVDNGDDDADFDSQAAQEISTSDVEVPPIKAALSLSLDWHLPDLDIESSPIVLGNDDEEAQMLFHQLGLGKEEQNLLEQRAETGGVLPLPVLNPELAFDASDDELENDEDSGNDVPDTPNKALEEAFAATTSFVHNFKEEQVPPIMDRNHDSRMRKWLSQEGVQPPIGVADLKEQATTVARPVSLEGDSKARSAPTLRPRTAPPASLGTQAPSSFSLSAPMPMSTRLAVISSKLDSTIDEGEVSPTGAAIDDSSSVGINRKRLSTDRDKPSLVFGGSVVRDEVRKTSPRPVEPEREMPIVTSTPQLNASQPVVENSTSQVKVQNPVQGQTPSSPRLEISSIFAGW
ncbi:hypothetical protein OIO90_002722 [Microbotryomycetes sp. JL221]|nr:hypothetical protein OIO90_002722 [Microbotryomycetes sp. JL221]